MKCSFYKWYSQALGAALGIIACIFAYLNGYMFVYTNIENNFDFLGFDGVIASYLLLPMCVLTLILAVIRSYSNEADLFSFSFDTLNKVLAIFTIIIGFLGAKLYFIVPAILIIISFISIASKHSITEEKSDSVDSKDSAKIIHNKEACKTNNELENTTKYLEKITYSEDKESKEAKLLITRKDIVIDLLGKGANIDFIIEITGFSLDEIDDIVENSINS